MQPSYVVNTQANYTLGGGELYGTAAIMAKATSGDDETVKVFVTMTELKAYYTSGALVDAAQLFFNNGGRQLTCYKVDDAITDEEYVTLFAADLIMKDWDYLMIPGNTDDDFHATIAAQIALRASEENKYSTFVTGVDKFEALATSIARTSTDAGGNIVVCHSALFNGTTEEEKADTANWLDATYTAAALTGKLCSLPVNDSPTYKTLSEVCGKSLAVNDYTKAESESLVSAGFVVIGKTFTDVYGIIMGVTRNGDSSIWSAQLDSKRKVDYIKENVFEKAKGYIGNPNDNITRNALKSDVTTFLNTTQKDRIIESFEVEVVVGDTPQSVDINTSVKLIAEVDYITFNLSLNI